LISDIEGESQTEDVCEGVGYYICTEEELNIRRLEKFE
jgi:hypothetical protein